MIALLVASPFFLLLAALTLAARHGRQRREAATPDGTAEAAVRPRYTATVLQPAETRPDREAFGFDSGVMIGKD
jgi:hypothetical protein